MQACTHLDQIRDVTPSAEGCEDCLKIGGTWVHLRECLICGHVGCCDSSASLRVRNGQLGPAPALAFQATLSPEGSESHALTRVLADATVA
jgi:hypothetical protein